MYVGMGALLQKGIPAVHESAEESLDEEFGPPVLGARRGTKLETMIAIGMVALVGGIWMIRRLDTRQRKEA